MRYRLIIIALTPILLCGSCLIFQPGIHEIYRENTQETYDAIIVPGIPFDPPEWDKIMETRVLWSVYLYRKGITQNIIFTGSAVHSPYRESTIMAEYAKKYGIPAEHIFEEGKAEHGSENLYYSYKLAKKLGFEKVALATDPYQGAMMFKHNRKFDLNIPYIPLLYDSLFTMEFEEVKIDYQKAYVDSFVKLNERLSPIDQYKNSMGRRVKQQIKDEKKAEKKARKEAQKKMGN
ncbi:YdcF family protein [bacterium SCSIO 12741]|nr:YdcF family protein [bacterium SCSIO 12741]